jgi:F-type H+-transporting ATPase subunit epsilon
MFQLKIITPSGVYLDQSVDLLNVRTSEGARGFLTNHVATVATITISELSYVVNNLRKTFAISNGLFYLNNNVATILTDSIESAEEIDLHRAQAAKLRAERYLQANKDEFDHKRAELSLKRAINRISVKNNEHK